MSELRKHPFLDTWVTTATHRQDRTFLPPADYNPLAPTRPGGFPTEVPFEDYDVVVFENKFPSLKSPAGEIEVEGDDLFEVRESEGVCEVVCYAQEPDATFAQMPFEKIRKLTRVWRDRYVALSALPFVEYVFVFENKGKEIGVTLTHPHGQIYAYPFIPATPKTELESERRHLEATGRTLFDDWLSFERRATDRIVFENESFLAVVPFFARYPYEVHVVATHDLSSLANMSPAELDDLAEALLVVTQKYDRLFGFSMPYVMAQHQEPAVDGFEFTRFHVEFYPPYRTEKKLKYLAGSEAGAGAFITDMLPEAMAERLKEIELPGVR